MAAPTGFTIALDGAGGARATSDLNDPPWPAVPEPAVIVLNAVDPRAATWVADNGGLAPADRDAFLAPVRRTWAAAFEREGGERAAVVVLESAPRTGDRVIGADVSRLIASRGRLVVMLDLEQPRPMIERTRGALVAHKGPRSPGELLAGIIRFWNENYLSDGLELDKATSILEDVTFDDDQRGEIEALRDLRRRTMLLRRRVAAHRTAIVAICALEGTDLFDSSRHRWRTLLRQSDEIVELVDSINERLKAIDDHVQNQLTTMLGDRLYVLTLISAILLPLSFMTGLLGVNIGGIPLRDSPWGFPVLCLALVVIAGALYFVAKRLNWLPGQNPRLHRRRSG